MRQQTRRVLESWLRAFIREVLTIERLHINSMSVASQTSGGGVI
jgi:hypothetical protein